MLLNEFLNKFLEILNTSSDWQVRADPVQRRAERNQILIGVGAWGTGTQPVEHEGVCLNNKGLIGHFGISKDSDTVTELVLNPPPELMRNWLAMWGEKVEPGQRLGQTTLVVEDAAPDAVLAFLFWLASVNGVAAKEFFQPEVNRWVQAVWRWEKEGMVINDPFKSWAALLSALSHSYFAPEELQGPLEQPQKSRSYNLTGAWREVLQFTATLLRDGISPDSVPERRELAAYCRATALLRNEQQDYQHSLSHSKLLQLLIPMTGPKPRKKMLVDAYLAEETSPNGSRKLFARQDRHNSYLKQGFAVMGIHRTDSRLKGTGNDIVISVDPQTGINLKDLWDKLEELENECWQKNGQRPTENPRPIASYPDGKYTQPWWDDHGRYTLLGAPRRLRSDGPPDNNSGSKLEWADVVRAIWDTYSPICELVVENTSVNHHEQGLLIKYQRPDANAASKFFLEMRWPDKTIQSSALIDLPSVQGYLATLISCDGEDIKVGDLPMPDQYTKVPLYGGFAIVNDWGTLVFDDWRSERLRLEDLRKEFENVSKILEKALSMKDMLEKIADKLSNKDTKNPDQAGFLEKIVNIITNNDAQYPDKAALDDLADLRKELTIANLEYRPISHWSDVLNFRKELEKRWNFDEVINNLHKRISQQESAILTKNQLKTKDLAYVLTNIGLPFFISGTLTGYLRLPNDTQGLWTMILQISCYPILAFFLIYLFHFQLRGWMPKLVGKKRLVNLEEMPDKKAKISQSIN